MLRDRLIRAIEIHFPDVPFVFGAAPDPVATLTRPCAEVGRLEIDDDGDEATVSLTEITHGHFNPYDDSLSDDERERCITEDVVSFLAALFADEVLLFRARERTMGGWRRMDLSDVGVEYDARCEYYLWSRPVRPGRNA